MEIIEVRKHIVDLPDLIYEAEVVYINKRALYEYLDDMKKHVLCSLKEGFEGSNPERESKAYASKEYKNHLIAIMEASIQAGVACAEWSKLKNKFDGARSLNKNIL